MQMMHHFVQKKVFSSGKLLESRRFYHSLPVCSFLNDLELQVLEMRERTFRCNLYRLLIYDAKL